MLRGFTTINFFVDDVPEATAWYTNFLGTEPYFAQPSREDPAYVEFRIGDHQDELGLISSDYRPEGHRGDRPSGAVTYWHVEDVPAAVARVVDLGGSQLEAPTERGDEGWVTAIVADPFGNVLGLMYSPHYLAILGREQPQT